jgi:membrane protein implicated in regulation of membrane protease activity
MDWDVFWSVLFVMFIALPLLFIWGFAIVDLFTRRDLSGFGKFLWLMFILFLPFIGTLAYYIFRPSYAYDSTPEMQQARASFVADNLTQLTALHDRGVLSDEEFNKQRSRILAEPAAM